MCAMHASFFQYNPVCSSYFYQLGSRVQKLLYFRSVGTLCVRLSGHVLGFFLRVLYVGFGTVGRPSSPTSFPSFIVGLTDWTMQLK